MESPLDHILTKIFLCHFEQDCLQICPREFKSLVYTQYIDDYYF